MSNFIIGYATYPKTMQEVWKLRGEKYEVFGKTAYVVRLALNFHTTQ